MRISRTIALTSSLTTALESPDHLLLLVPRSPTGNFPRISALFPPDARSTVLPRRFYRRARGYSTIRAWPVPLDILSTRKPAEFFTSSFVRVSEHAHSYESYPYMWTDGRMMLPLLPAESWKISTLEARKTPVVPEMLEVLV